MKKLSHLKKDVDISKMVDFCKNMNIKPVNELIRVELMSNLCKQAELRQDDFISFSASRGDDKPGCYYKADKMTMNAEVIRPEDIKKLIEKLKPEKYVFNIEGRNYIFDVSKAISCFSVIWINPNALKEIDIEPKEGIEGHKFYYGTRIIEVDDMPEYMLIGFDSGKRETYYIDLLNKNYMRINSFSY